MPIKRCMTENDVESALESQQQASARGYFLFFGSDDPETGESWCPDCVTADPLIRAVVTREDPEAVLHECPVGLRSAWKGVENHSYKVHPVWRLERIPTLILLEAGIERGRLVEADCADEAAIAAFVKAPTDG